MRFFSRKSYALLVLRKPGGQTACLGEPDLMSYVRVHQILQRKAVTRQTHPSVRASSTVKIVNCYMEMKVRHHQLIQLQPHRYSPENETPNCLTSHANAMASYNLLQWSQLVFQVNPLQLKLSIVSLSLTCSSINNPLTKPQARISIS